ncbi:hypothetical protein Tco_0866007 [Tanacetum coccineum]
MFSIKKTSVVHEKIITPRSCLRWVPTGKIFSSSTTKVDSEPLNGSNENITNPYECEQTLDEFKYDNQAMTSDHNSSELRIHDHDNEPSSSKLVPKVVPLADKTATSRKESYALSWKPCQGDSLNLPDHRIHIKMEMEMPHSS